MKKKRYGVMPLPIKPVMQSMMPNGRTKAWILIVPNLAPRYKIFEVVVQEKIRLRNEAARYSNIFLHKPMQPLQRGQCEYSGGEFR